MRHMLHFRNWTGEELLNLVKKGLDVKQNPSRYVRALKGKTLAMVFQKTSTRTRGSFEAGMTQLGGMQSIWTGGQRTSFSPMYATRQDAWTDTRTLSWLGF